MMAAWRDELVAERASVVERFRRVRHNFLAIDKGFRRLDKPSFADMLLDIYQRQIRDIDRLLDEEGTP